MCLGIPGRVTAWLNHDPLLAEAEIDFGGVRKRCHMACVPDANVGDYVLVHAGVALARVDTDAAEQTLSLLSQAGTAQVAGPNTQ